MVSTGWLPFLSFPMKSNWHTCPSVSCWFHHYQVQTGARCGAHAGTWYTFKISEVHHHPHGFNIQLPVNSLLSQTRTSPHQDMSTCVPLGGQIHHRTKLLRESQPSPQGLGVLCCPLPPPSQPAGSAKSVHSVLSSLHPPAAQATVTALTCDTTVASEPASSQRSLPKPRPAPLTSPESHCLSQPATI